MFVWIILLGVAMLCAVQAVRATHLLHAALWLAGVSAAVSILLYLAAAYVIAVIELSLSVGLITILLVFAISMVGADSPDAPQPSWFHLPLVGALLLLLIGLTVPSLTTHTGMIESSFAETFWQGREGDVFAQVALIFAGVLGVLGLLTETRTLLVERHQRRVEAQHAVPPEDEQELERV